MNSNLALYTAVTSFGNDVFHLYSVVSYDGELADLHFVPYNNPKRLYMDGSSPHLALLNNLANTRILLETRAPDTNLIRTKLDEDGNLLAMHLSAGGTKVWGTYNPKQRYEVVRTDTELETLKEMRDNGEQLVAKTVLNHMLSEAVYGPCQISVIKDSNQKGIGTTYYVGQVTPTGGVSASTTYPELAARYANEYIAKAPATTGGDIVPLLYELYPDLKLDLLRKFFQTHRYVVLLPNGRYMSRDSARETTQILTRARTFGAEADADLLDQNIASLYEAHEWSNDDTFLCIPVYHTYNRAMRLAPSTDGWRPKTDYCKP